MLLMGGSEIAKSEAHESFLSVDSRQSAQHATRLSLGWRHHFFADLDPLTAMWTVGQATQIATSLVHFLGTEFTCNAEVQANKPLSRLAETEPASDRNFCAERAIDCFMFVYP